MEIKENNEITVQVKGKLEKLYTILQKKNFKIKKKFLMNDIYFIPQDLDINNLSTREILSRAILAREIIIEFPEKKFEKKLTFKKKEIDLAGNIISQKSINCEIFDLEDGKELIKSIGYKEILQIREKDSVYEKEGFELAVKAIENGENLIEVETNLENPRWDTIEKIKTEIVKINIPIYLDNYFVKKAEIELNKILKR